MLSGFEDANILPVLECSFVRPFSSRETFMTGGTSGPESNSKGWLRRVGRSLKRFARLIQRHYQAIIGWFFCLAGPIVFVLSLWSTDELNQVDSNAVIFAVAFSVTTLLIFALFSRRFAREAKNEHIGTALQLGLVGVSATAWLLLALGQITAVFAKNNHQISITPHQSQLHMGDVYRAFLFASLDVVPALEIPATLGWENPIADPAAPLGVMLVLAKFIVLVVVISSAVELIRAVPTSRFRRQRAQTQEQPAGMKSEEGAAGTINTPEEPRAG
jgi:hypothetical protein